MCIFMSAGVSSLLVNWAITGAADNSVMTLGLENTCPREF